eukprot:12716789-Ditylum_brightwellii.AAC.1
MSAAISDYGSFSSDCQKKATSLKISEGDDQQTILNKASYLPALPLFLSCSILLTLIAIIIHHDQTPPLPATQLMMRASAKIDLSLAYPRRPFGTRNGRNVTLP